MLDRWLELLGVGAVLTLVLLVLLSFVVAPLAIFVEERRRFSRMSFVRTMATAQMWILLTMLEALQLGVAKYLLGHDVRIRAHESCRDIAAQVVSVFFARFKIEGVENIPPRFGLHPRQYVVVANHTSMVDVAAIFALRLHAAWVAKSTIFMIPGVGWLMWLASYVSVTRTDKASIKAMYSTCKACVQEGWSLVIFPQGTRNRAKVLPFKNGAYNLAAELRLPLLPVSIIVPDDIWLDPAAGPVRIVVHPLFEDTADAQRAKAATFRTIMSSVAEHGPNPAMRAAAADAIKNVPEDRKTK